MKKIQLVDDLLSEYELNKETKNPQRLIFNGFEDYDIYNPTAPFGYNGNTIIIGRVERRDSEVSQAVFFKKQNDGTYSEFKTIKRYELQDPFITKIGRYFVFGGTEIFEHPDNPDDLWWRTKFYYGEDLSNLEPLAIGPNGMKDIRIVQLSDKRIGVFTRPQGEIGGRGKIGFTVIDDLFDLSPEIINGANLLEQFDDEEWGGVNEAVLLENGLVGVLGHIAKYSRDTIRHYYPVVFTFNPQDLTYSPMKIIASRSDFLKGPSKRDDLIDVLFSAGLILNDEQAILYTGVSDVEVQSIEIENPFKGNCNVV